MKADTGATSSYIRCQDIACTTKITTLKNGPQILQPDRSTLQVTQKCELPLHHNLSTSAKSGYIISGLKNSSLLSIGKLCDDNCIAMFTKTNFFIFKNNNLLLQGFRNNTDGLWDVLFPVLSKQTPNVKVDKTKSQSINYIIQSDKCKLDLANYFHACCFSPCISTFTKAINNGNFLSWPGINSINFKKILNTTQATLKRHIEQERKNLQTTKPTSDLEIDYFPQKEPKIKECIFKLIDISELNEKSYMDLCRRFPYTSTRGAKYILVIYDHDSNLIEGVTLKSRNAKEITDKWEYLYQKITRNNITTKYWI